LDNIPKFAHEIFIILLPNLRIAYPCNIPSGTSALCTGPVALSLKSLLRWSVKEFSRSGLDLPRPTASNDLIVFEGAFLPKFTDSLRDGVIV
jgi:hypothetical protein